MRKWWVLHSTAILPFNYTNWSLGLFFISTLSGPSISASLLSLEIFFYKQSSCMKHPIFWTIANCKRQRNPIWRKAESAEYTQERATKNYMQQLNLNSWKLQKLVQFVMPKRKPKHADDQKIEKIDAKDAAARPVWNKQNWSTIEDSSVCTYVYMYVHICLCLAGNHEI